MSFSSPKQEQRQVRMRNTSHPFAHPTSDATGDPTTTRDRSHTRQTMLRSMAIRAVAFGSTRRFSSRSSTRCSPRTARRTRPSPLPCLPADLVPVPPVAGLDVAVGPDDQVRCSGLNHLVAARASVGLAGASTRDCPDGEPLPPEILAVVMRASERTRRSAVLTPVLPGHPSTVTRVSGADRPSHDAERGSVVDPPRSARHRPRPAAGPAESWKRHQIRCRPGRRCRSSRPTCSGLPR